MLARLHQFKERDTRRLFAIILGGNMLGIIAAGAALFAWSWYFNKAAGAQTATDLRAQDLINPLNTVWVLVAAFLVFFMQAGFMALEAGFARSKESVNIMMECVFDTCLCGILWWAIGFAFMFGEGNGIIGHHYFFLQGTTAAYGTTQV